jgi:DNA replication protein DnaC
MYRQSNLRNVLKEENFEHFSLDYYPADKIDPITGLSSRECAKSALANCLAFAEDFGSHSENLMLFGDTGLGKTFLSHCIAAKLMDNGFSVVYFSAARMFEVLSDHLFRRNEDSSQDTMDIRTCDLLIIDDLGTELPNALTVSLFFDCLNDRLLAGKSTLISTNLDLSDIREIYSERVSSRIFEHFRQIHLYGDDIRIRKKTL